MVVDVVTGESAVIEVPDDTNDIVTSCGAVSNGSIEFGLSSVNSSFFDGEFAKAHGFSEGRKVGEFLVCDPAPVVDEGGVVGVGKYSMLIWGDGEASFYANIPGSPNAVAGIAHSLAVRRTPRSVRADKLGGRTLTPSQTRPSSAFKLVPELGLLVVYPLHGVEPSVLGNLKAGLPTDGGELFRTAESSVFYLKTPTALASFTLHNDADLTDDVVRRIGSSHIEWLPTQGQ